MSYDDTITQFKEYKKKFNECVDDYIDITKRFSESENSISDLDYYYKEFEKLCNCFIKLYHNLYKFSHRKDISKKDIDIVVDFMENCKIYIDIILYTSMHPILQIKVSDTNEKAKGLINEANSSKKMSRIALGFAVVSSLVSIMISLYFSPSKKDLETIGNTITGIEQKQNANTGKFDLMLNGVNIDNVNLKQNKDSLRLISK